jgi:hypothetical protein
MTYGSDRIDGVETISERPFDHLVLLRLEKSLDLDLELRELLAPFTRAYPLLSDRGWSRQHMVENRSELYTTTVRPIIT